VIAAMERTLMADIWPLGRLLANSGPALGRLWAGSGGLSSFTASGVQRGPAHRYQPHANVIVYPPLAGDARLVLIWLSAMLPQATEETPTSANAQNEPRDWLHVGTRAAEQLSSSISHHNNAPTVFPETHWEPRRGEGARVLLTSWRSLSGFRRPAPSKPPSAACTSCHEGAGMGGVSAFQLTSVRVTSRVRLCTSSGPFLGSRRIA
jgi:hypothetical protein